MRRLLAVLVALLSIFSSATLPAQASDYRTYETREVAMERANHHVHGLTTDPYLQIKAQRWANALAERQVIAHGAFPCYCGNTTIGQNVGMGPSLSAIESAFQHSPGHLANEIDPDYRQLGIGISYNDGLFYVVQDYRG